MIHRDRPSSTPAILDLNNAQSLASKERKKAIDYVNNPAANPKPKFSVYSHDDVKLALINLFEGKCAYCESKVNPVAARDIEHYRPKGQIDPGNGEEVITPGYYWLAANWDNLLLSCPACNRRQRQLEALESGELIFTVDASGKLDLFPLGPGATRATGPDDDLSIEEPGRLLLNPCVDAPEKHLRYDKEGNVFARTISGKPSPKGLASIKAYVLWRHPLVEDRHTRFLEMKKVWANILDGSQMIDKLDSTQKAFIARFILRNEADLLGYLETKRRFTGMARWLSRGYLRELRKIKERFKARFGESIESAAS
jgi:hypothetical protein